MDMQQDTRDRLIRLETHVERALPMIETLYTAHVRKEARNAFVVAAIGLAKHIPAGAIGGFGMWLLQHFPIKAVVVGAILLTAKPALAIRPAREPVEDSRPVVAWVLEIKACRDALCVRKLELPLGSASACEIMAERVQDALPDTTPAFWGFDGEKPVEVRTDCLNRLGDDVPA